ncbi:MAG: uncharacterized protein PWP39_1066 [Pyrococcus sp.]|uniref:transglutaminase-like domain-containing protein n=1 Tax=Pyrococcus sp. TaxID=33866 RepID=UPI00258C06FA|nr:transglutaminase-like domain-containing protein [Pyrococcus sp.]MDK2869831.1 uncharacterized protein [Pyrococcus sp.]
MRVPLLILLFLVLTSGCIAPSTPSFTQTPTCLEQEKDLNKAIKCYLEDPREIKALTNLSKSLKGPNEEWTIWNILKWEEENLKYDDNKPTNYILRPSEFLVKRKGVCTDYTVLTLGLLLTLNYSQVGFMIVHYAESTTLHSTAIANVSGTLFVLDQKLPPLDLGSYIVESGKAGKLITQGELYYVSKSNGSIIIEGPTILGANDFIRQDYKIDEQELKSIEIALKTMIAQKSKLSQVYELKYSLPRGFKERRAWILKIPRFRVIYNPIFKEQYLETIIYHILEDEEIKEHIKTARGFYLEVTMEQEDLIIKFYLAK